MSYYDTWIKRSEDTSNQTLYQAYVNAYYDKEKTAYDRIFSDYPDNSHLADVKVSELAGELGYSDDEMDLFLGFLDGINPSLNCLLDLPSIEDDSSITLDIDYEKLYLNMREAKADWLYGLPSWKKILSREDTDRLTIQYRESKIVRTEKVGRNDPCPCGSGKKYKQCCMNK